MADARPKPRRNEAIAWPDGGYPAGDHLVDGEVAYPGNISRRLTLTVFRTKHLRKPPVSTWGRLHRVATPLQRI